MSSTEAWGLCNNDSLKIETMEMCSDDYIIISFFHESCYFRCFSGDNVVILVAHFYPFVSQHASIVNDVFASYDLSAHPIANDVLAVGLTRKAIYYLVNCNIRVSFCLRFLGYIYALASFFDSYPMVLTMNMTFLSEM